VDRGIARQTRGPFDSAQGKLSTSFGFLVQEPVEISPEVTDGGLGLVAEIADGSFVAVGNASGCGQQSEEQEWEQAEIGLGAAVRDGRVGWCMVGSQPDDCPKCGPLKRGETDAVREATLRAHCDGGAKQNSVSGTICSEQREQGLGLLSTADIIQGDEPDSLRDR